MSVTIRKLTGGLVRMAAFGQSYTVFRINGGDVPYDVDLDHLKLKRRPDEQLAETALRLAMAAGV